MRQWEYQWLWLRWELKRTPSGAEWHVNDESVRQAGLDGWELVSVVPERVRGKGEFGGWETHYLLFFKRPL